MTKNIGIILCWAINSIILNDHPTHVRHCIFVRTSIAIFNTIGAARASRWCVILVRIAFNIPSRIALWSACQYNLRPIIWIMIWWIWWYTYGESTRAVLSVFGFVCKIRRLCEHICVLWMYMLIAHEIRFLFTSLGRPSKTAETHFAHASCKRRPLRL